MTKRKTKKKLESKTKTVRLINKPLRDVLFYLCDEAFIEIDTLTRTGDRTFTGRFILQKKTAVK